MLVIFTYGELIATAFPLRVKALVGDDGFFLTHFASSLSVGRLAAPMPEL
jgi:hypothetical protein